MHVHTHMHIYVPFIMPDLHSSRGVGSGEGLDEALALEILICAPVIHIALCILELLLHLCLESSQLSFLHQMSIPVTSMLPDHCMTQRRSAWLTCQGQQGLGDCCRALWS